MIKCNLLKLICLLYRKETRQRVLGIWSASPFTTFANRVSNTPTQPTPEERPALCPPQTPSQSSALAYVAPRGFTWNCITAMIREDKSCPGCRYYHPKGSPRIKFHQGVACPTLAKHGYYDERISRYQKRSLYCSTRNPPRYPIILAQEIQCLKESLTTNLPTTSPLDGSNPLRYRTPHSTPACHQLRLKITFSYQILILNIENNFNNACKWSSGLLIWFSIFSIILWKVNHDVSSIITFCHNYFPFRWSITHLNDGLSRPRFKFFFYAAFSSLSLHY